nr:adp-ribosylation factor-like protein 2 [Quercus suber]
MKLQPCTPRQKVGGWCDFLFGLADVEYSLNPRIRMCRFFPTSIRDVSRYLPSFERSSTRLASSTQPFDPVFDGSQLTPRSSTLIGDGNTPLSKFRRRSPLWAAYRLTIVNISSANVRLLMISCPSGLDNAGKTTIVKRIMNEDVNSVSPTLGFIIKTIEYDGSVSDSPPLPNSTADRGGRRYKLNICWCALSITSRAYSPVSGDVGGQKTLRTYWKNYFEKTDTLIWVVDATDRERLNDCKAELHGLLKQEVRTTYRHCGYSY